MGASQQPSFGQPNQYAQGGKGGGMGQPPQGGGKGGGFQNAAQMVSQPQNKMMVDYSNPNQGGFTTGATNTTSNPQFYGGVQMDTLGSEWGGAHSAAGSQQQYIDSQGRLGANGQYLQGADLQQNLQQEAARDGKTYVPGMNAIDLSRAPQNADAAGFTENRRAAFDAAGRQIQDEAKALGGFTKDNITDSEIKARMASVPQAEDAPKAVPIGKGDSVGKQAGGGGCC
jgi:hypothetical protein